MLYSFAKLRLGTASRSLAAVLAFLCFGRSSSAQEPLTAGAPSWSGWRAAFSMGAGAFGDSSFWEGLDHPLGIGIQTGYVWPSRFGLDVGVAYLFDSGGESTDLGGGLQAPEFTVDVIELSMGPMYSHPFAARWEGYAGVGLSWVSVEADTEQNGVPIDDGDSSLGIYLRAGVNYLTAYGYYVGLDFRALLGTDVELDSTGTDLNYLQVGLVFGGA